MGRVVLKPAKINLVAIKPSILNRKLHRWGALTVSIPLLIIICSGVLLQLKKTFDWIQPPTQQGSDKSPKLSFEDILRLSRSVPEAGINSWEDIDRLDVRPGRGIVKVRSKTRWGIQLDSKTGEILNSAYRRSDLIENIHDGSWFHKRVKLAVFLPTAVILLGLWGTGLYLFYLPYAVKRRNKRK